MVFLLLSLSNTVYLHHYLQQLLSTTQVRPLTLSSPPSLDFSNLISFFISFSSSPFFPSSSLLSPVIGRSQYCVALPLFPSPSHPAFVWGHSGRPKSKSVNLLEKIQPHVPLSIKFSGACVSFQGLRLKNERQISIASDNRSSGVANQVLSFLLYLDNLLFYH